MFNKIKAFYMIEILLVLVIISIMVFAAYPIYNNYLTSTRRAEGKVALYHLYSRMERYFSLHHTYATATIGTGNSITDILSSDQSTNNWYSLEIANLSETDYLLKAVPQGKQAENDTKCGTLTLSKISEKGITGDGTVTQCW